MFARRALGNQRWTRICCGRLCSQELVPVCPGPWAASFRPSFRKAGKTRRAFCSALDYFQSSTENSYSCHGTLSNGCNFWRRRTMKFFYTATGHFHTANAHTPSKAHARRNLRQGTYTQSSRTPQRHQKCGTHHALPADQATPTLHQRPPLHTHLALID